ncbi:MAG: uncharacterized protein JWL62_3679, partial [Hyphomicrobiales bacterium]|nr:uncharacterized protein [Hyphomicrobiales bacterium]
QRRGAETLARAERDLPRGETTMGAPSQTLAATDPAGGSRLDAPLPPRRPAELATVIAAATPDIPLPPVRPLALAALSVPNAAKVAGPASGKDAFPALLARAADLPDVIKQGTDGAAARSTSELGLMAYAPEPGLEEPVRPALHGGFARGSSPAMAQAVGVRSGARRKPQLVAARLDRSNFVALTRPEDMARTMPQSQLGSATGLRAAVSGDMHALVFSAAAPVTSEFGPAATDLSTDVFSGPAVRPLQRTGRADTSADRRIGLAALSAR